MRGRSSAPTRPRSPNPPSRSSSRGAPPLAHWADRADVAGTALDQVIIRWTLVTAFGPRPRPLYGFAVEVLLWLAARGRLQPAARQRLRAVLRWTARTQERRRRAAADILLACPSLDARTLRSLLDAFPDWRRLAARVAAHPSTPVTLLRRLAAPADERVAVHRDTLVGARAASGRDAR